MRALRLLLLLPLLGLPAPVDTALAGEPEPSGSVVILAQSDSRGELRPCHCPGNRTGGLSRRSGVIQRLRRGQLPVVALDGGDFVSAPGESLAASVSGFMVTAMELIDYDAVGVGELELILGLEFLRDVATRLPLVCANLRFGGDDPPAIPTLRWVDRDGLRIAVTAVLDPLLYYQWAGAFERPAEDLLVFDAAEGLEALRDSVRGADLVVVLVHADLATTVALGRDLAWVDVVVQAHEPELGTRVVRAGGEVGPLVVEPGPRSRQLARLTVAPGGEGWEAMGYQVLDLKLATQDDSRIDALLEAFEAETGSR